jgi:hypothetical protein
MTGRGAGRIELCSRLIEQARECLGSGDRECAMKLVAELIENNCHNGNAVGKVVADGVRDIVYGLWRISDYGERCELLNMLKNFMTKGWIVAALHTNSPRLIRWFNKCGIDWEDRMTRSEVVKMVGSLLRRLGWGETKLCEELWKFVGIDVGEFKRHGVELCNWLEGLEELSDLKKPYWWGLLLTDGDVDRSGRLKIGTTNLFTAILLAMLFSKFDAEFYLYKGKFGISPQFCVMWPWRTKGDLESLLNNFNDMQLAEFLGGVIDGDGMIRIFYTKNPVGKSYPHFEVVITAGPKKINLALIKNVVYKKLGIMGRIYKARDDLLWLTYRGEEAVKLLRLIRPYVHHPLRRLRLELILMYKDGKLNRETFDNLVERVKYKYEFSDVKRGNALEILARAAPQTHTRGGC